MTRFVRAAVAAAAVPALAIALTPAVLAADHAVDIAGFAFSPQTVTVKVGDSVTWSNADAQNHTATANDGSFDTGTITTSTPKSVSFATAGTFAYHCKIHPSMTATVVVQAAAGGGGSGASAPPTDTEPVAPARPASPLWLALIGVAIASVFVTQRRFARASARG